MKITLQTGRVSTMEVYRRPKPYIEFKGTRAYKGLERKLKDVLVKTVPVYATEIEEFCYSGTGTEAKGSIHGYHFADKLIVFYPTSHSDKEITAEYERLANKLMNGLTHLVYSERG